MSLADGDSCQTCRFHISQSCRRHAPTIRKEGMYGTKWPTIAEAWRTWCGDHELADVVVDGVPLELEP